MIFLKLDIPSCFFLIHFLSALMLWFLLHFLPLHCSLSEHLLLSFSGYTFSSHLISSVFFSATSILCVTSDSLPSFCPTFSHSALISFLSSLSVTQFTLSLFLLSVLSSIFCLSVSLSPFFTSWCSAHTRPISLHQSTSVGSIIPSR